MCVLERQQQPDGALRRCLWRWDSTCRLGLSVAIALGALIHAAIGRRQQSEADSAVLFSAGLVAGEALMGILTAALVTAGIKLPLG